MKKLPAFPLFFFLVAASTILAAESKPENNPSVTATANFTAKLPPKVFLLIVRDHDRETMSIAIRALGPIPNTEFFVLPKEATRPQPTRQDPPIFPGSRTPGQAWIMGLIDPSGRVTAVHCVGTSSPEHGASAVAAVGKWRFKPAKLNGETVPVLFVQLIEFNVANF